MNQETLQELFVEQIRDIYDAEKQLVKALPKLAKAADSDDLADGLRNHLVETQGQVTRLEEVFGLLGIAAKGKPCKAMKGLIEEGSEVLEEEKGEMRDLAIIAACQRVEHYEISAYGTVRTLAEHLNMTEAAELLQQTEDEEKEADSSLTKVAMSLYESSDEGEEADAEADNEEEEGMAAVASRGRGSATTSPTKRNGAGSRKSSR